MSASVSGSLSPWRHVLGRVAPLPVVILVLALATILPASALANTPLLRVDHATGAARLNWSGGVADFAVYESSDPRRVVSPARVATTTPGSEWLRANGPSDPRVLFFQVSCPGGGCDETCFDGADNDGDALVDCQDDDCAGVPDCVAETNCGDGLDDEGDDLIDCDDPDCGLRCDDGEACNGVETCNPADGSCLPGTPVSCDDGLACNGLETCDPADGSCLPGTPVTCDDGLACNGLETCDPTDGSCLPGTPVSCDDGLACNGLETCDPADGSCLPGTPVSCDDGLACNGVETCDPSDGSCLPGTPVSCDDGLACNGLETCDPADGSCLPGTPVSCDDGDACDGLETCDPADGSCLPGTPVSCDDGDPCNGLETCDPADGSCLPGTGNACDDGNGCNGLETCDPADGSCLSGTPVTCDDGNFCTVDDCDPVTGLCRFSPLQCDDDNPCTIDTCDPSVGCSFTQNPAASVGQSVELAGNQLAQYPFFEAVRAFNRSGDIEVGLDPTLHPDIAGATCDVYVVAAKSASGWCDDRALIDVRGGPDTRTFGAGSIQAATFPLVGPNVLSAAAGEGLGAPHDVVLDCNRDGLLDETDFIDGGRGEAGLYVVHDLTVAGPLAVTTFLSQGPLSDSLDQSDWAPEGDDYRVAYPSTLADPAFTGTYPMIVISHGNGHSPDWYHDLQAHLASYGFIVFAHDNHTIPGIETASSSTLFWTDKFIAEQGTIVPGGVLAGHLDDSRIIWIGHSRGGEGVTRAVDRIRDEGYTPSQFTLSDLELVISMAPTDFLGGGQSNVGSITYGLLYGAQDNDVNGCTSNDVTTSFNLFERATGLRASHYVHGANHAWFHDCNGQEDAPLFETPPEPIPCGEQNKVQFGWVLAYVKRIIDGSVPAKDFLWRQYESLRPTGVAATTKVVNDYRDPASSTFVIDDYQTEIATNRASCGATVSFTVSNLAENICDDGNTGFDWGSGTDAMNGMTRGNRVTGALDDPRCTVFDYNSASQLQVDLLAGQRDWSSGGYLQLRACQGSRHPRTTAALENLTFTVTLVDGSGRSSSINVGAYGGGVQEPYQRRGSIFTGCNDGTAAGWGNEFEVIRIRLADFRTNASGLDLSDIASLRLQFGGTSGSSQGRIGLDDIRLSPP